MKIAITGVRGVPAKYGGFETFAEELGKRIAKTDEVLVVGDASNTYTEREYLGIQVLNSPHSKSGNPIKLYHDSLKIAKEWGADVAVMCGVGGVFSIPFFRGSKMKILVNPDGLGWKREKWVWWKKIALYGQFQFCARFAKYIVCDSHGIKSFFEQKFHRKRNLFVAEYGSKFNPFLDKEDNDSFKDIVGQEFSIKPNQYYLVVSRLEPENNVESVVKGYAESAQKHPLIVVGNTDTAHAKHLLQYQSANIRFVNGVYDAEKLSALRFYAKAYFHGHSVGGTNPSLLEAMGSKNLCVAHDNVFNREVLNNRGYFFKDETDVKHILDQLEDHRKIEHIESIRRDNLQRIKSYYNWEDITQKYMAIFKEITE